MPAPPHRLCSLEISAAAALALRDLLCALLTWTVILFFLFSLQTRGGEGSGYGSTYWGNVLFSRFANEPAKLDGAAQAAEAPTSMLEESGKMSKASRNQLMKKLKGELENRLSLKQPQLKEGAQAAHAEQLTIQQPKEYGKVSTIAATTTRTTNIGPRPGPA